MNLSLRCALSCLALLCLAPLPSSAVSLTGAIEFSCNQDGYHVYDQMWNTRENDGRYDLWIKSDGNWLNGPNDVSARINVPLSPGTHTFDMYGEPGYFNYYHGLNLFFDGSYMTPGISVFGPTALSAVDNPPFYANSGSTLTLSGTTIMGSASTTYVKDGLIVSITGYRWTRPEAQSVNLVSSFARFPSTANDWVGSFTLQVAPVPEPASLLTLAGGILMLAGVARRRR